MQRRLYLWLVLIPLLTIPLTAILETALTTGRLGPYCGDRHEWDSGFWTYGQPSNSRGWDVSCPAPGAIALLAPGLLNLVPALGLRSLYARTRFAARIAATGRLLVPVLVRLGEAVNHGGTVAFSTGPSLAGVAATAIGLAPWLTSVVLLLLNPQPSQAAGGAGAMRRTDS